MSHKKCKQCGKLKRQKGQGIENPVRRLDERLWVGTKGDATYVMERVDSDGTDHVSPRLEFWRRWASLQRDTSRPMRVWP
jgi:hypothetical protein